MIHKLYFFFFLFIYATWFGENWNGKEYKENSSIQKSHGELMVERLHLKGNERILDVGCGTGELTKRVAQLVPNGIVIGLDPSLSMLEIAKKEECENLKFVEGSAETCTFDQPFDCAIAFHVMHWISEQQKALDNIAHHLVEKGKVFFILAPSKEGLPFYNALTKSINAYKEDFKNFTSNQQSFDIETHRKLMVKAGFQIDEIRYFLYSRTFPSPDSFGHWVMQWLPH